jgi:hypothetical protein
LATPGVALVGAPCRNRQAFITHGNFGREVSLKKPVWHSPGQAAWSRLSADVQKLDDFLREAKPFLDLVVDKSPTGP